MSPLKTLLCASALALATGPALAEVAAVATTDLNVRSGPGPEFPVAAVIGVNQQATVLGCLESSKWCEVAVGGTTGWAYSDYLVADVEGAPVVVYERREAMGVPVVTYDGPGAELAAGTTGAIAGAIVGGPVGAAVGGAAGVVLGDAFDPERPRQYIVEHPVDPVYLDGEVVVGGTIPETVTLYEIPEAQYRYVYLNGQQVLVAPDTREIVHVYR
jgi:Uncharacterized protein with a bacterial SH3 domain homologue